MDVVTPEKGHSTIDVDLTGLARELTSLPVRIGPAPWPGYEHARGYGIFSLPFSSEHVLALRVFPQNDFAPFVTIWHRNPQGDWSIFYDAPRPDIGCPRYFGTAAHRVQPAHITVTWTGPMSLQVEMDAPALRWRVSMRATLLLRAINAVSGRLPRFTWRSSALAHCREWMARRVLGMGNVTLVGRMPSGHHGILMPMRVFFIHESQAILDGLDLGRPIRARDNPSIGEVRLSARPTFVVGQGFWEMRDADEYRRTREELRRASLRQ